MINLFRRNNQEKPNIPTPDVEKPSLQLAKKLAKHILENYQLIYSSSIYDTRTEYIFECSLCLIRYFPLSISNHLSVRVDNEYITMNSTEEGIIVESLKEAAILKRQNDFKIIEKTKQKNSECMLNMFNTNTRKL